MVGATDTLSGLSGLVPTPQAGDENKVLKGNGQWSSSLSPSFSAVILPGMSAVLDTVGDSNSMKWVTTTNVTGFGNFGAFETIAVATDCANYGYVGNSLDVSTDILDVVSGFQLIFTNNETSAILINSTRLI
jgi:hypothetical protein